MKPRILLAACICASLASPMAIAQSAPSHSTNAMSMQGKHVTNKADRTFAKEASAANLAEVKLGKLAQSQGTNSAVKAFGQRMIDDHTAANQKLSAIASDKSLTVSQAPSAAQQKEYDKLKSLHGDAFDHEYAKKAVHDHHAAIHLFTKEEKHGTDPSLRGYASQTLPTLKEHLSLALKLPQG